jgi:hypothetical protein
MFELALELSQPMVKEVIAEMIEVDLYCYLNYCSSHSLIGLVVAKSLQQQKNLELILSNH